MRDPRLSSPRAPSVHRDVVEHPVPSTSQMRLVPAQMEPFLSQAPRAPSPSAAGPSPTQLQWLQQSQQMHYHQQQQRLQQAFLAPPPQLHQQAPAPRQPSPPPQPQPVHRVYVLRCATCDTFLSDRGMRAVLLLKPNIVLFSTDAQPCNSETFFPSEYGDDEQVERTCDCLTSSINCHGCGRTVGYHIVSPCNKCNASVQKHQRSANHHRYVFHAGEVTARERTYYPSERGVSNPIIVRATSPSSSRGSSPSPTLASRAYHESDKEAYPYPHPSHPHFGRLPRDHRSGTRTAEALAAATAAQQGARKLLKRGDTVYWHHLVSGGERVKSVDPRTREPLFHTRDGR
ncbi:hypothetical protein Rhopal_005578-T1 [Rhodotorula paludigena]|uniref:C2H2-type domain-containing protein n=1 Tax=Rhodotorula paludigena TaxID=86838 RepID=A0AAV5GQT3_9BASI|nr:hypothetical protein Rhopal_005578-T1 [Rhodotorula paludigena]